MSEVLNDSKFSAISVLMLIRTARPILVLFASLYLPASLWKVF